VFSIVSIIEFSVDQGCKLRDEICYASMIPQGSDFNNQ